MPAASAAPTGRAASAGRTARAVRPLRRLTVLYDPECRLCAHIGNWLPRQRQLVPLDLVPAGSAEARRRFPALDHAATRAQVTVVGDAGQVYRGDTAWVVVLWALADHRAFSHTLTTPAGRRLARAAALTAAKYRELGRRPAQSPASGTRTARGVAPGWTYDKATGWTQADVVPVAGSGPAPSASAPACAGGCAPPG